MNIITKNLIIMKKSLIATFLLLASFMNVNAQTVIKNDYSSTTTDNETEQSTSDSFGTFNLQYMSFDGFENYGFIDHIVNPNNLGYEFGIRYNFKEHGNMNIDLGINYSFELSNKNDNAVYMILAAGPSFRLQDKYDGIDKNYNIQYKLGFFVDGYINPRLSIKFSRVVASIGYFYWAPEFKFSKDDGATGGVNLAIGINLM